MTTIREGRWDCRSCGTTGNMGRDKSCPHCGAQRPNKVKFYLPEGELPVSNPDLLRDAQAGPDWQCSHCSTHNAGYRVTCSNCGAERGSSVVNEVVDYTTATVSRSGEYEKHPPTIDTLEVEDEPRDVQMLGVGIDGSIIKAPLLWGAGITAVLGLILFFLFMPRETTVSVSGFTWERNISLEHYVTLREEDWSVPAGGRVVNSWTALHHYEQVLDHYETKTRQVSEQVKTGTRTYTCGSRDLGNGYFEDIECSEDIYETRYSTESYQYPVYRSEPRYATRYSYDIERWVFSRKLDTSGSDHEAFWASFTLASNEREQSRYEKYIVKFTDKDEKSYSYQCGLDEWLTFRDGQSRLIKVNRLGIVTEIIRE